MGGGNETDAVMKGKFVFTYIVCRKESCPMYLYMAGFFIML